MTPQISERNARRIAFVVAGVPPEQQRHVYGQILRTLLRWGHYNQNWSMDELEGFAADFANAVVRHWPHQQGQLQ